MKTQECFHDWHPVYINEISGFIVLQCKKCSEYAWQEIKPIEWIGNIDKDY